jgi:hypothetical protein
VEEQPMPNEDQDSQAEYGFLDAVIEYLDSEKGHDMASKSLQAFFDFKKTKLENHKAYVGKLLEVRSYNNKFTLVFHSVILFLAVITAAILTYCGKFDSTIGVFFGTILGYVFSKQQSVK